MIQERIFLEMADLNNIENNQDQNQDQKNEHYLTFEQALQIAMQLLLQNDKDLYDEIITKINTALKNIDSEYAKKIELHEHSNKALLDSLTNEKVSEWDTKSNFSGNYNDLTNQPQINGELLQGNKTLEDIGLSELTDEEIDNIIMNLGGL